MKKYKYFLENSLWNDLKANTSMYLDSAHYSEINNLTYIRAYAFYNRYMIKNITLPNVSKIDYAAFASCDRVSQVSCDQLTIIGGNVFGSCSGLKKVYAPKLSTVGSYAFSYCLNLSSLYAPKITRIEDFAFYYCWSLTNFSTPEVSWIGTSAFYQCDKMTDLYAPNLTMIGSFAFYNCGLKNFYAPKLPDIPQQAFQYNRFSHVSPSMFPIIESISRSAFVNCTLKGWFCDTLASSIDVYDTAFSNCDRLQYVGINKLNKLYNNIFTGCENLSILYIFNSSVLKSVSSTAVVQFNTVFSSTPMLSSNGYGYGSIYVPASLYSSYITDSFWSVASSRIVSFNISNIWSSTNTGGLTQPNWEGYMLSLQDGFSYSALMLPMLSTVSSDGSAYFCQLITGKSNHSTLTDLIVPTTSAYSLGYIMQTWSHCSKLKMVTCENCVSVVAGCFQSCYSLSEFNCGSMRIISPSAFKHCSALKSFDFTNVEQIYNAAFQYCGFSQMSSLHLEKCKFIKNGAFDYVTSAWSKIYLTEKCSSIGTWAFGSNKNLTSVYIMPDSSITSRIYLEDSTVFGGTSITSTTGSIIFCDPFNSMMSYYKTASNWSYFSNRMFYSYSDPWGEDSSIETY